MISYRIPYHFLPIWKKYVPTLKGCQTVKSGISQLFAWQISQNNFACSSETTTAKEMKKEKKELKKSKLNRVVEFQAYEAKINEFVSNKV